MVTADPTCATTRIVVNDDDSARLQRVVAVVVFLFSCGRNFLAVS